MREDRFHHELARVIHALQGGSDSDMQIFEGGSVKGMRRGAGAGQQGDEWLQRFAESVGASGFDRPLSQSAASHARLR